MDDSQHELRITVMATVVAASGLSRNEAARAVITSLRVNHMISGLEVQ